MADLGRVAPVARPSLNGHEETLASKEGCRAERPVHPRQPTFMNTLWLLIGLCRRWLCAILAAGSRPEVVRQAFCSIKSEVLE